MALLDFLQKIIPGNSFTVKAEANPFVRGVNKDDERIKEVASILYGEAAGEKDKTKSMTAVANTIQNRAKGTYGSVNPQTTYKIATSKEQSYDAYTRNIPQYQKAKSGNLTSQEKAVFDAALEIASNALNDKLQDITGGATHYYNPKISSPSWAVTPVGNKIPKTTAIIESHKFMKDVAYGYSDKNKTGELGQSGASGSWEENPFTRKSVEGLATSAKEAKKQADLAANPLILAGRTIMGIPSATGTVAKDIGQSMMRNFASVIGSEALSPIVEPIVKATANIEAKSPTFKFFTEELSNRLYGDLSSLEQTELTGETRGEQIKLIGERTLSLEDKLAKVKSGYDELLKTPNLSLNEKAVLKSLSAIVGNKAIAPLIIGGYTGLDIVNFGGSQKNVFRAMKEATKIEDALKLLTKLGLSDDLAKQYGEAVVKVSTDKEAKALFDSISKIQLETKAVKPAEQLAKENFDKKWADAYGNRPPTIDSPTQLQQRKRAGTPAIDQPLAQEATKVFKNETGMPFYDDMLQTGKMPGRNQTYQEYFAKEKGKVAEVVYMSPDEYLSKIVKAEPTQSSIDYMKAKLAKGEKLGMPSLDYTGEILSQEGRNRAYLAKELGLKQIPVLEVRKSTDIWNKANQAKPAKKILEVTYKELDDLAEKIKNKDLTEFEYQATAADLSALHETADFNPARKLMKYVSRATGNLPEVTGKRTGEFAQRGDQIITELGFKDMDEAQESLNKYIQTKRRLNDLSQQLSGIRKEKSAIKKGEVLMSLAKGDRRSAYRAVREAFGLSDADMATIRQGKDIMAMSKEEFDIFIKKAEIKAIELDKTRSAMTDLQFTIQDKDLRKWENIQATMKLPNLSEMNPEQLNKLNDVLSQYKTGDEFLPVRQLETIGETELKGLRTVREVKEHLAKKYNLTAEELPPIKPHPWMYDAQLARQNPLYDLLVDRYNYSYLKANGRIIELERKNDELIRAARKSRSKNLLEKIKESTAPVDKRIKNWLEAEDIAKKESLAKEMTKEELAAAQYEEQIYKEYYDWLSKREMDKKFASRFEDKYFPHTRRGFLEAWKEDGFLKAFKEAKDQFIQEEKLLTILDEKTKSILPYQKWIGFTQRRSGNLIPTENASRAFKTYVTALEKARQFDEFIPEVMIYVHSLTPRNLTTRGVELDDSVKRFIKSWINSKKGRVEKQIAKPGGKVDYALRMGVAITRIRDLGLNIPVGIANIFGEQAGNLTMLGAKNYSLGVARLATSMGREITKKYANFVGKTFWEKITEASNTAGDQLMGGVFGLFGAASRKGNQVFLLGSMTPAEFAAGEISIERLAQLRKGMGKYRVVEGAESIFGKSAEGAVSGQYKKWAIPIIVSTLSNINKLTRALRTQGISALKTKEGAELFYSVVISSIIGAGSYGYYNELKDKKDRSFVEDIIYKSIRDSLSMISALDPAFITSEPRLVAFIGDLGNAISNLILLAKKASGELKGLGELKKILTPVLLNHILPDEKKPASKSSSGNPFMR